MKKKISILIYSLASGGSERVVSILLKELNSRYDITLVLMNYTIFYDIPKAIEVVYLENSDSNESGIKKLLKLPILGWKYRGFLKENGFSASVSFMNRPNYMNVFAKLFGSKTKTIISERITPLGEYGSTSVKDIISRFLIRFLYPKANMIIPNSKLTKDELNNFFHIPKNKIKVVYNPIDIQNIEKLKKETVNLQKERFTFITVGRLEKQKNHILLINAFHRLNLDAELWFIGDGCLREDLEFKIKELGIEKNIRLLGRQKNPYKFLEIADCFVFSSNYEGFPNVVLEALACGLPVISTDCKSGPREIIAPDSDFKKQTDEIEIAKYGILVPINNAQKMTQAMQMIMSDKELQKRYIKSVPIRAMDFDKAKIINQYINIIESI